MNWQFVMYSLGKFLLGYAGVLCICLFLAIFDQDNSMYPFFYTILTCCLLGSTMSRLQVSNKITIGIREGYCIVLGIWLSATVFGAMPLFLQGAIPNVVSAWFEAVSGLTTTGATVIADVEALPRSILLWRSLMHWLGGVGIIMLFVAVLPNMGVGVVNLVKAEASGPTTEKLVPRMKDTAVRLWIIYVCLTLVQILLLYFVAKLDMFDSINYSMSAMACGGFATKNSSVAYYNNPMMELIIATFMIIAGGNFNLYMHVWRRGLKVLKDNTEFVTYLSIICVAMIFVSYDIFLLAEYNYTFQSFRDTLFQVVSFLTGTGFASTDFEAWPEISKTVLIMLMFLGGCAGSTTGGLKTIRVVLTCKLIWAEIKRSLHPRAVESIKLDGRALDNTVLNSVIRFVALYMLTVCIATVLVAATGLSFMDSLCATLATVGNVGLGFGIVGPSSNAGNMPAVAQFILSWCMLLGRLEFFTLLVVLQRDFWRANKGW